MSYHVKLGWKIFASLSPQGAEKTARSNPLFNIKGGRSFLRTLGGNPRAPYEPTTVEPTKNFHSALRSSKIELGIEGKQLSFTMPFDQMQQRLQVTIGLRKYFSCICASVKLQEFSVDDLATIFEFQDLKAHKALFGIISEILAVITSGNIAKKKLSGYPKIFPVVQVTDLGVQAGDVLHSLVEILTRHPIDERDVVDSVLEKNKSHKIDSTLVLIDKQGVLSYLPPGCTRYQADGNLQRFQNASSLLEFANAIRQDIRAGLTFESRIDRIVNDAKYFLPDSISSQKMWELLVQELSMQYELEQEGKLHLSPGITAALPSQHNSVLVQQFFSKEISMGDKYNVTGQVGAVGPNSRAERNIFNQVLQQAASTIDLPALALELAMLRNSMREQATEIEHDQAVVSIGAAESAAKQQNGVDALEHLKSAGKWAFDVATTIGATIAAAAIQTAIGL
ncbi:hypothetical protein [Aquipseudomonas ullengensis]|uniref:Uncharacterized protein n=1 Tax=Aquipseudomonas ullengensis TaxID=2759166 RepID=A0A7W4QBT4_9GAMM|nr:hypothetical protein [Pseudomonas ullengensis]MBB2496994.1 hypothetical protein [Pseudomonas ullengensis]